MGLFDVVRKGDSVPMERLATDHESPDARSRPRPRFRGRRSARRAKTLQFFKPVDDHLDRSQLTGTRHSPPETLAA